MMNSARLFMSSVAQFAAFPSTDALLKRYIPLVLLAVLLAASLKKAISVWQEIHDVEEPDAPGDLLASFEQAHAEGELDDVELARVREKLTGHAFAGRSGDRAPSPGEAKAPRPMVSHEHDHEKSPPDPLD
jgi:hypothetical protein